MKTIYINGRYLTQRLTGVQRFATETVRSLDEQLSSGTIKISSTISLVVPPGSFPLPSLKIVKIVQSGRLRGHAWEQLELPRIARDGLLFNPCGPAPLFHPNQITVLHDASIHTVPAGYSWQFRMWHKLMMWRSGIHARLILTVSQFSRRELVDVCGISEDRIQVIYQSGEHILRQACDLTILSKHNIAKGVPYVLCVGSQQANKNFAAVAKAADLLRDQNFLFVVVGSKNPTVFRASTVSHENIIFTGYVSDAGLRTLYEHAMCFVFPSLYEGFGIPPLEAMACGCPVIASDASSIPEVCGTAALYFDPNCPAALSQRIMELFTCVELRDNLRKRGLEHTKLRSWQETSRCLAKQLWPFASSKEEPCSPF